MIRKAVIPVAGLGTRLLPLTKALPKEMMPILDRPVIQLLVEELVAAGVEDVYIVTTLRKSLVQEHFAPDPDLENELRSLGKDKEADEIRRIWTEVRISYLYQQGPYGNGTPVLNASRVIGDEPFIVLWGDDFFQSDTPRARQLVDAYDQVNAPVIALTPVPRERASKYGMARLGEEAGDRLFRVEEIVEKPAVENAPSEYACVGGYVVTPPIMEELERLGPDESGEVYLSAALDRYARRNPMYGQVIEGIWHDTGTLKSYLETVLQAALRDPDLKESLRPVMEQYLR
ncbi:UTP--glucose-1-phosphate uridylyltransferase [Bailinhaonella thermotolerans]|uniref:UTP--glucose-1-phosphate uridylyltransferase n=1 Tax=Bailinhaonella thermotolerans TaxID=1070861 RepID=A0A3A4BG91_9ACTN|nr:UTP--glucose-1-phosphate uridylyltransferase [Bailinhaonella thermotolerans]RJL30332.1 UTP--glucose-1-phosphate uridylyltransferase [Bailinhaonella thermotolerans]